MTSTTVPRVRPRRADVRRALLDAAAEAFGAHPYPAVSLSGVAEAAGFTKGAVYSNFGGKPQLFAEMLTEQFTALVGGLSAQALAALDSDHGADVAAVLAAALTDSALHGTRLPAMLAEFRTLAVDDPALAEVYLGLRRRQRSHLEQLLRSVAERVPLRPGVEPALAATLLLTVVNGVAQERVAAPEATPEALVEALFRHVLESVLR